MYLEVNNERMQKGNTNQMIFKIEELVSYMSHCMTLYPGDICCTGTPPGVGENMKPPKFLLGGEKVKLGVDKFGLDIMDRNILEVLIDKFSGGPVGIKSLGVAVGEDPATIEDVYEPYLIKQGFMQRTSRGRIAQESAYKLLEKPINKNNQKDLFND